MNDRSELADGAEVLAFSLPRFLNILYRGRWLILGITLLGVVAGLAYGVITKPLYLGTVQVRPGIVTYNAEGDPIRGWALKDVVQWYEQQRFWLDMREKPPFDEFTGPPIILAEFIPIGLQWTPGGNIITLSHLSRSRETARLVLQESIDSFNRQAMESGNDTDIELAVANAQARIEDRRNDLEHLDAVKERAEVDIRNREGDLKLLDAELERVELQRLRLAEEKSWRTSAVKSAQEDLVATRGRLTQAQQLLEIAISNEDQASAEVDAQTGQEDPVTSILLTSARREQAGRVVQLLDSVGRLERYIFDGQVKVDTLSARIRNIDLALDDLDLHEKVDLAQKRETIRNDIARLRIQLDRDLPYQKTSLENKISLEEMKVEKLEALEQISPVQVTDKPVRPRKIRALAILAVLAFFASLALVLVREYYLRNRAAITAR